jgi:hypothetical protein
MSNPPSKNDPHKQLAVAVLAATVITPVMVATPAAAAVESAQQKVALLRKLALAQNQQAPEHVVLRKAVFGARLEHQPVGICTSTHTHTNDHSNYHYNCTGSDLMMVE